MRSDREFVYYLGKQIRRAIAQEHLPKERAPGELPPPADSDLGFCECHTQLRNTCTKKILDAAFKAYAQAYPERFW